MFRVICYPESSGLWRLISLKTRARNSIHKRKNILAREHSCSARTNAVTTSTGPWRGLAQTAQYSLARKVDFWDFGWGDGTDSGCCLPSSDWSLSTTTVSGPSLTPFFGGRIIKKMTVMSVDVYLSDIMNILITEWADNTSLFFCVSLLDRHMYNHNTD